ncbi:MAG: type I DNA topoisomerase [Ruminococcaceae bacterium]|nr:type I DNA topoisomerase [Oscillospiraceae bacterium]
MANLIIVESPFKINTIKGYLGSNYKVTASVGHVRDLPKSTLGIDIDNNFEAHYINIRGKGDVIRQLKKEAKAANKVFLATDPDREGEAISWHLATALGIDPSKACRITFNELTKSAVKDAVKHPRPVDMDLVNSQQTRRILDRIVGYKLSPYLWKTVKSGLSAGRVQSVATRIIVEREREIEAFIPEEYWTVDAMLRKESGESFLARYYGENGKKSSLACKADADAVLSDIKGKPVVATTVRKSKKHRMPAPPFTTSTMQQEASKKLNFQSARIMKVAQELYEGINIGHENGGTHGLITYMRTDSLRISDEAQNAAFAYIEEKYGESYRPAKPHAFKANSTNTQDAHEAIRPTDVRIEPASIKKYLTPDQFKLYKLIWERFVASSMESAVMNTVNAEFACGTHSFRATGYTVEFPGFLALYEESADDSKKNQKEQEFVTNLPPLSEGEKLDAAEINEVQHFTEPPARFTEASLIKFFEEMGIGRPSTYTPIISTILQRGYVKREGKSLKPTNLGELTTKIMEENFPKIMDYEFTARMESDLDGIEAGSESMLKVLDDFYSEFKVWLEDAFASIEKYEVELAPEETDIICDKCGARMIVKNGRYGKFAACPNYPECKNTKQLGKDGKEAEPKEKPVPVEGMKCELCGGDVVLRTGKFGEFYACVNYPKCKFTKQKTKDTGITCPDCGGKVVMRFGGKRRSAFYSCENYPTCQFSSWMLPTAEKCPKCGKTMFVNKSKNRLVCGDKSCGYVGAELPASADITEENE